MAVEQWLRRKFSFFCAVYGGGSVFVGLFGRCCVLVVSQGVWSISVVLVRRRSNRIWVGLVVVASASVEMAL